LLLSATAIFWPTESAPPVEPGGTSSDSTASDPEETPVPDPPVVRYDLESVRTVEGTMISNIAAPSGSILFLEVLDSEGERHLWAVEGDSPNAIREAGWDLRRTIRIGDTIRVRVHPAKAETTIDDVLIATAALRTALASSSDELAFGTDIILPDGQTLPFGTAAPIPWRRGCPPGAILRTSAICDDGHAPGAMTPNLRAA
jgi:hypothetical protein